MAIKFVACTNCRALSGTVFYVLPDRWFNFWQQEHLGHFLGEGREERPLIEEVAGTRGHTESLDQRHPDVPSVIEFVYPVVLDARRGGARCGRGRRF